MPCIGCGYDLRASDPNGNCPECGTPVFKSSVEDSIHLADRPWARRVAFGARRLAYCVAGFYILLGVLVTLFGTAVVWDIYAGASGTADDFWGVVALCVAWVPAFVLNCIFIQVVYLVSEFEPGRMMPRPAEAWRKFLSWAWVALVLIRIVEFIAVLARIAFTWDWLDVPLTVFLTAGFIFEVYVFIGCTNVIADCALRVREMSTQRQAVTLRKFSIGLVWLVALAVPLVSGMVFNGGSNVVIIMCFGSCCLYMPVLLLIMFVYTLMAGVLADAAARAIDKRLEET